MGDSYGDLQEKFKKQCKYFKTLNIKVEVIWECNFMKNNNIEIDDKVPLDRLCPRDALRGGKTECFNVYYNKNDNPEEIMNYIDFNSLYPYSAITNRFPVGN